MRFPERINKILPRIINDLGLEAKVQNWQVVDKWSEIVGSRIAKHTRAIAVDAENLFVEVDNPIWQSQLFIMKAKILRKIRDYHVNIKDIKFKIAASPCKEKECQ